jgi:hypothetical protein
VCDGYGWGGRGYDEKRRRREEQKGLRGELFECTANSKISCSNRKEMNWTGSTLTAKTNIHTHTLALPLL